VNRINILGALSTFEEYHTSIILTYGANLAFYEQGLLSRFWSANCRNNLIFMDADRYQETILEAGDALGYIGRRYLVNPLKVGRYQAFHAKLILLLGSKQARLLIGSGNLNFHGYGDNLEVFTQFDWSADAPRSQSIFCDAWNAILAVQKRWGRFEQTDEMLKQARSESPWIEQPAPSADFRLFNSLDKPLIQQMQEYVGNQKVEKITVLSPFLDRKASAIENLAQKFKPRKFNLLLQNGKASGDPAALKWLAKAGVPLKFYVFEEERYAHAKVYAFESRSQLVLATGSANCTQAGLLSDSAKGNFELLVLQRYESSEPLETLLGKFLNSEPVELDDSIALRPISEQGHKNESLPIDFQEVNLNGQSITGKFEIQSLPATISNLRLVFSLKKDLEISLDEYVSGINKFGINLHEDQASLIGNGTCPVAIYGYDPKNKKSIRLSSSLWLVNTGELNRLSISLTFDNERAGQILNQMYLGSDEEWRTLYNTIITLIEFDVDRLKSTRPIPRVNQDAIGQKTMDNTGRETIVRIVDDRSSDGDQETPSGETRSIQDGALSSWLKIVFAQFPLTRHPAVDSSSQPVEYNSTPRSKPNQSTGYRFLKLTRRYIRSLHNPDFTRETPPYYLISYFSVFNKITWLLYQHDVIEESEAAGFITAMHAGFFGVTDFGVVPFTAEETRYHLSWQYENYATSSFAYLYALTGLLAVRSHLSERDDLFVQALACISVFVSPSEILENTDKLGQIAASYNMPPDGLAKKLAQIMHKHLPAAQEKLDSWSVATAVEMKGLEKSEVRNYQYALLSMSIALERIAEYRNDFDHRIDDCADVVYWAGLLGQSSLVDIYQDKLIELYKEKGNLRAVIHSLIEKGNAYRSAGERENALKTLSQAQSLAKEVRDPSLMKQVEIFQSAAKFLRQVK
jgi:hypothetical protein